MRLDDLTTKHSKGRHRRRTAEIRIPLPVVAIVAAVALGLTLLAGGRPAANPPAQGASAAPSPGADTAGQLSNDEILQRFLDPALLEAVPVGPEPVAEPVRVVLTSSRVITTLGESGIPEVALKAYKRAAARLAASKPSCGLHWSLLAAIGRVESNHGRFGGAQLRADGYGTQPIRGIPLDGRPNVALIRDTDNGKLDGDRTYDRAVGPMQFIPSTWRSVNVDGNGDGERDPNNIFDAAAGAGVYLCAGVTNLREPGQAATAVRRYNNADTYVRVVLNLARQYRNGGVAVLPYSPPTPQPTVVTTVRPPATARPSVSAAPTTPSAPAGRPTTSPSAAPAPDETVAAPTQTAPAPATTTPPASTPTPAETGPAEPSTGAPTTEPAPSETATASGKPTDPPETAAVGWAPAMRETVLSLLQQSTATPTPSGTPTDTPVGTPSGSPAAVESARP